MSESGYNWAIRGGVYFDPTGSTSLSRSPDPLAAVAVAYSPFWVRSAARQLPYYQECFEQVRSTVDALWSLGGRFLLPEGFTRPSKRAQQPSRSTALAWRCRQPAKSLARTLGSRPRSPTLELALARHERGRRFARWRRRSSRSSRASSTRLAWSRRLRSNAITVQRSIWIGVNRKVPRSCGRSTTECVRLPSIAPHAREGARPVRLPSRRCRALARRGREVRRHGQQARQGE